MCATLAVSLFKWHKASLKVLEIGAKVRRDSKGSQPSFFDLTKKLHQKIPNSC